MSVMQSDLRRTQLANKTRNAVAAALQAYEDDFKALATATRAMGLSSEEGLHGEMRRTIHQGEELLNEIRSSVIRMEGGAGSDLIQQVITSAIILMLITGAVIVLFNRRTD